MNQPQRQLKNRWALGMFLFFSLLLGLGTVLTFFGWSNATTGDFLLMLTMFLASASVTFVFWRFPNELRQAEERSPERTIKSKSVQEQILFWKQQIRAHILVALVSPFIFYIVALLSDDLPIRFFFFVLALWAVCIYRIWHAYKELKTLN